MKKIELAIIGAQKAGTSSINLYLSQHPNIFTHNTREFGMFVDEDSFSRGLEFYFNSIVDSSGSNNEKFVIKHVGLMYDLTMLKNLRDLNPDVKVVCILRNPIDRAFSAFNYGRKMGWEPWDSFESCFEKNENSRFNGNKIAIRSCDYIGRGLYFKNLLDIYSVFPKENVHLFLFEEIINDLNNFLMKITFILNLPSYDFNTKLIYNKKSDVKFRWLSQLLAPGKVGSLKNLIPFKYRMIIRKFIRENNVSKLKNVHSKLDLDTRTKMIPRFIDDVVSLNNATNLDLKKYWPEFFIKN